MASGGYRRPGNPAAVSGPGALSQRTDGGPSNPGPMLGDGSYGDSADMAEIQSGADMGGPPSQYDGPLLTDPSARPDEPVTAGADLGAGPGSEILGLSSEEDSDLSRLAAYLPVLEYMANQASAHPSTRAFVRRIKASL